MTISYSRPSVRGRAIWGELVPFDKPWRTGANAATTITFSDDVTVEGQKLAAGTYSIVTIPGKDEWTVVFNTDTKLWFETEYDAAKDVLRVKAKPQACRDARDARHRVPVGRDDVRRPRDRRGRRCASP